MTLEDAVLKFRRHLEDHYSGKQGSREWMKCDCRTICNACTNKRYKPFYISVTGESPIYMKCFKISSDINRFATMSDFEAFGFTDTEAIKLLIDRNNRFKIKNLDTNTRPIVINDYILSTTQNSYWKKRLGFNPTLEDIMFYRFIPDIDTVMTDNYEPESEEYMSYKATGIKPGKTGMTFLTTDFGMVSYRGIDDSKKLKFNLSRNTSHGYTLKRGEEVKSLVLAEGIFDIINIYNIFARMDNTLYCASLGFNSFENDICHWYQQHIDTVEQLIIFADSDRKLQYGKYTFKDYPINNLIKRLGDRLGEDAFKKIYICYNSKGKDFGDLSSPIEGERIEIK